VVRPRGARTDRGGGGSLTAVPNRLPSQSGSEPFVVELDRFRGPLDLLLHLIRSQDIDIFDIPISQITRQFQTALEADLERLELDRAGEFIELAANLVRIKAQMLLPRSGETDWDEDPRAELVQRLLEYEMFQEVARALDSAESQRRRHFGKGFLPPRPQPAVVRGVLTTTLEDLLEVAFDVRDPDPITTHFAPIPMVTVEEKIDSIRRQLRGSDRVPFSRLFHSWRERQHVVAALLACLELAKQQFLRLEQVSGFGSIWIFRQRAAGEGEPRLPDLAEEHEPSPDVSPDRSPSLSPDLSPDLARESQPHGTLDPVGLETS